MEKTMTNYKVGIHSIIGSRKNFGEYLKRIVDAGEKIPLIKCVDDFGPAWEAKELDLDTLTVGRLNVGRNPKNGQRVDMQAWEPKGDYKGKAGAVLAAQDYYAIVKPIWDKNPQIDIWETFNEYSWHWDWQGWFYIAMIGNRASSTNRPGVYPASLHFAGGTKKRIRNLAGSTFAFSTSLLAVHWSSLVCSFTPSIFMRWNASPSISR